MEDQKEPGELQSFPVLLYWVLGQARLVYKTYFLRTLVVLCDVATD